MRKRQWIVLSGFLCLCLFLSACAGGEEVPTATSEPTKTSEPTDEPNPTATLQPTDEPQPESEIEFPESGTALLSIPALDGNQIEIRITKPEGDGPFPALIGVAGGDGSFAFYSNIMADGLKGMGIVAVDFAPEGRLNSEGEDDHHGPVHQDDLKALVDFVSEQPFVQPDNIGILTYSYGLIMATGALSRYPDMPVAFLIDWEGPSSPGRDIMRGVENEEPWAIETILTLSVRTDMSREEMEAFVIHGGMISDEAYWADRDASLFIKDLPCPYLRVQFDEDHVQGTYKTHMMLVINAATEYSDQWTRLNDNPPNVIYTEENLADVHFHTYDEGEFRPMTVLPTADEVLLAYVDEMFFTRPYEE
ncbi:MAG: hypothetical protein JXJ17_04570 [Anaerolineae bacterium]|nr:hypothetical protein [Anaerolineae bacterium]